jgi:hypothetical protein
MVARMFSLLFGCRHRRLTRPITPARKPGAPAGGTYVACLDCGNRFHYDVTNMRMGEQISRKDTRNASTTFQSQP